MPSIWAVTCVYVVVLGLCYPQVHVHLGGLCCQMKSWFCRGPGCYCGSCLTVWSKSRQAVCWCLWLLGPPWGARSLDSHPRPYWCRRTLLLPGACWSGWPVLVFFFFWNLFTNVCRSFSCWSQIYNSQGKDLQRSKKSTVVWQSRHTFPTQSNTITHHMQLWEISYQAGEFSVFQKCLMWFCWQCFFYFWDTWKKSFRNWRYC